MLYRPFEHHLNIELGKHDLYRAQWSTLYYLANNGSATLVELAQYQQVEKPTVTRIVSRLEELRYIEPIQSKDRREKPMQLTGLGRKVYADVRISVDRFEQDILEGVSEARQKEAIGVMKEIRNNLISKEPLK
ncbi:MarR family winged helix-turn-helix transcriptional regulator [Planococcus shenhongbingii]|uniref:MarR family winged helix-turn-helix transcriptional regulator n=1 Tax=Planococcus shenhongbingii TaxID=3058398 RepID=UPI00345D2DD1